MLMHKVIVAFLFGLFIQNEAWSNQLPNRTTEANSEIHLESVLSSKPFTTTGEATFSILFWDLYQSHLKTTSGTYPISFETDQLIFHIDYLADISREDLIMRTVEQWQHQNVSKNTYNQYIETLQNMWPNIRKGDSLAILVKKERSNFYFNERYIGSINDDAFGQLFIDIWLDKSTSQPNLRAQLLGETLND